MASACVNGPAGASPESFLDRPPSSYSSYGWLSPRVSFSRDLADGRPSVSREKPPQAMGAAEGDGNFLDFEFRLGDPATMLSADELFADGKLVPLQLTAARTVAAEVRSPEPRGRPAGISGLEPCAVMSPRAPTCSSRWRELLGLRKLRSSKPDADKAAPAASRNPSSTSRSLKHLLHRNARSAAIDPSLSLPLLRDPETEHVSISSRLSHSSSSSSSGPDHEDLPRLSLDTDKQSSKNPPRVRISRSRSHLPEVQAAARTGRSTSRRPPGTPAAPAPRSSSVDSPRLNSSGKVIFQGLGRSSSSPSSFNGGQRARYRGMEFTPVLNVPVFGLGHRLRKEKEGSSIPAVHKTSIIKAKIDKEKP